MVENGMIVGESQRDPQRRRLQTMPCACCGDDVPISDGARLEGAFVCNGCLPRFCAAQFSALGQAYLEENTRRYQTDGTRRDSDDLYLNWWFENLEKPDRLRLLMAMYGMEQRSAGGAYCREWEKDYCLQAEDWQDFVTERMKAL